MGQVVADISISLDGYVTGPDPGLTHGLGIGAEGLHTWAFDGDDDDQRVADQIFRATGAVLMGRNLFDIVDAPGVWTDEVGYGANRDQSSPPPVFVVTHTQPERVRLTNQMHIVTDGLHAALDQAQQAAGDADVVIMGGGSIIAAYLDAGLVDRLSLHIAPLALRAGTPLFTSPVDGLRLLSSVTTTNALHVVYAVSNAAAS